MGLIISIIALDVKPSFAPMFTPSCLKALKNFVAQYEAKDDHALNLFELFLCAPCFHGDAIDGQYSTLFNNSIEKIIVASRDLKQQAWESGLMWQEKVQAYQLLQCLFLAKDKITKITFEYLKSHVSEFSINDLQQINNFTDEIGQWSDGEKCKTMLNQLLVHPDLFATVKRIDNIARSNSSLGLYMHGARTGVYVVFIHAFFAHIETWSDEELFVLTTKEVREYLWNQASLKIIFTTKKYDDLPNQALRDAVIAIDGLKNAKKGKVINEAVSSVQPVKDPVNKKKQQRQNSSSAAVSAPVVTKSLVLLSTHMEKLEEILEIYSKNKSRWNFTTPDFVSALQVFTKKYKNSEDDQVNLYELLYCCAGKNTMLNNGVRDVKVNRAAWSSLITFIAREANARQDSLLKCLVGLIVKENILPECLEWLVLHPEAQASITHAVVKDIEALSKDLKISHDNFKYYFNQIIRHPNIKELRSSIDRIIPQQVKLALSCVIT